MGASLGEAGMRSARGGGGLGAAAAGAGAEGAGGAGAAGAIAGAGGGAGAVPGAPGSARAAVDHERAKADSPARANSRGRAGPSIVGRLVTWLSLCVAL